MTPLIVQSVQDINNVVNIQNAPKDKNSLDVDDNSKVGIGTTTPSEKLDINGNISVAGSTFHTADKRLKEEVTQSYSRFRWNELLLEE